MNSITNSTLIARAVYSALQDPVDTEQNAAKMMLSKYQSPLLDPHGCDHHIKRYSQEFIDFCNSGFDLAYYSWLPGYYRDLYEWRPEEHPRDGAGKFVESGSAGIAQRTSKVRELVARPDLSPSHRLHLNNLSQSMRLTLADTHKGFRNLWNNALRSTGLNWTPETEESIWNAVDKNALRTLLDSTNQMDHTLRSQGNDDFADACNYNDIIPKQFAERLHGGSRFFDPEKLGKKWSESNDIAATRPSVADEVPFDVPAFEDDGERMAGEDDEDYRDTNDQSEDTPPKSFSSIDDLSNAFTKAFEPTVKGLSKVKSNKLDAAIRSAIADDDGVVKAFKPIVVQAWKEMSRENEEHNSAVREIMGVANHYLEASGYQKGSTARTPQALAAFVRRARARTLDPAKQKGFDEMVDRAQRNFPHLLAGRGEDGFMDLLSQGLKKAPNVLSQEVAERATTMAGPSFFQSIGILSSPGQSSSTPVHEPDWDTLPFSWLAVASQIQTWRYSLSENQLEAGNYSKKHIRIHGLQISIETEKGKRRRPEWPPMPVDYGYIRGTTGNDGDHLDVFVGPDHASELVVVVDQLNERGQFDEHKAVMGFNTESQAVDTYRRAYTAGWKVGPVTSMTIQQFKSWLEFGKQNKKLSDQIHRYSQTC